MVSSSRIGIRCSTSALGLYVPLHAIVSVGIIFLNHLVCDCTGPPSNACCVLSPWAPTFATFISSSGTRSLKPAIEEFTIFEYWIYHRKNHSQEKGIVTSIIFFVLFCLRGYRRRCPSECGSPRAWRHSLVRDDIRKLANHGWKPLTKRQRYPRLLGKTFLNFKKIGISCCLNIQANYFRIEIECGDTGTIPRT